MREYLIDRPPADPHLPGDLLLGCLLLLNAATDVPPLRDLAIHEVPPPKWRKKTGCDGVGKDVILASVIRLHAVLAQLLSARGKWFG